MSDWRPIESAPRDGTRVLGWNGVIVTEICWLSEEDDNGHKGWCEAGFTWGGILYDLHYEMEHEPTHWMPLPDPPEDT